MAMKPLAPKPMGSGKKNLAPKPRAVRLRDSKPVPMPGYKPRRVPGQALPAPMPTVEGNYGKPRGQRTGPKQMGPAGPKKKSPGVATPKAKKPSPSAKTKYGPLPKNPTLNDYLMRGIRPPSRNKPGTRPSDSDVILRKYNDKKYKGK
jgi:hypothetical protein